MMTENINVKPASAIKTDADYRSALNEVESLMIADPDTPEGEKLDVMVTLIEAYEAKHFPMDLPDPVEAIKFEMERKGLTVKDLEPMIGKKFFWSRKTRQVKGKKKKYLGESDWAKYYGSSDYDNLIEEKKLKKK